MNARDDSRAAAVPMAPRRARLAGIFWIVLAGAILGPWSGVLFGPTLTAHRIPLHEARVPWKGPPPSGEDWSAPRGAGESAVVGTIGASSFLAARAPTSARAQSLAIELALARLSRSPELGAPRAGRRTTWSEALLAGPRSVLSPGADCAARLRGWAGAWRAVVAPAEGPAGPGGDGSSAAGHESAITLQSEVARRALAADAAGLEDALEREARVARGGLFARIASLPGARREVATESWRRAWERRAADLDIVADALESRMSPFERELVLHVSAQHALAAEPRVPDPGVIQLLAASGAEPAAPRPYAAAWALMAAVGAAVALAIALPLTWGVSRVRRARREGLLLEIQRETAGAFSAVPRIASTHVEARLQVVSGPRPRRVASTVRELAARFLSEGQRVLVVDSGRHLRIHESFGANGRLGFQECMNEGLPLLGVLQSGGLPGIFVLAHGSPARLGSWTPLRGLLEQARPHFSRIILAIEPNVPRQAGDTLAGRLIDGWWTGPHLKARDVRDLSRRLGVPFQCLELDAGNPAPLAQRVEELTRERTHAVAPGPAEAAATAAEVTAAEVAAAEAPAGGLVAADAMAGLAEADAMPEPAPALASVDEARPPDLATVLAMMEAAPLELTPADATAIPAGDEETMEAPALASIGEPIEPLEIGPALEGTEDAIEPLEIVPAFASAGPGAPELTSAPAGEPVVLDCDPEVGERLRFLIWMRRLRDKKKGEVAHAR